MTQKQYVAIARAIHNAVNTGGDFETARTIAEALADTLAEDNAKFDRKRFMLACGFFLIAGYKYG